MGSTTLIDEFNGINQETKRLQMGEAETIIGFLGDAIDFYQNDDYNACIEALKAVQEGIVDFRRTAALQRHNQKLAKLNDEMWGKLEKDMSYDDRLDLAINALKRFNDLQVELEEGSSD